MKKFLLKNSADCLNLLKDKKIGILLGNRSIENLKFKEIAPNESLDIYSLTKSFDELGISYSMVDTTKADFVHQIQMQDIIWINMHGEFGEDGTIQGLLEYLGKKYIGTGVAGSALCNDKIIFKRFLKGIGIQTPDFFTLHKGESDDEIKEKFQKFDCKEYIIKPSTGGSSVFTAKLKDFNEYMNFQKSENIWSSYKQYLVEEFIDGRLFTLGFMEIDGKIQQLPLMEIYHNSDFYSLDVKRGTSLNSVEYIISPRLKKNTETKINKIADTIIRNIECRGFGRIDLILRDEGIFILEVNTIPGVSYNSNLPTMCRHEGISHDEMVIQILHSALRN